MPKRRQGLLTLTQLEMVEGQDIPVCRIAGVAPGYRTIHNDYREKVRFIDSTVFDRHDKRLIAGQIAQDSTRCGPIWFAAGKMFGSPQAEIASIVSGK